MESCKASVVFLQETKLERLKPMVRARLCGKRFEGCAMSLSVGAPGGLFVLWDKEFISIEYQLLLDRVIVVVDAKSRDVDTIKSLENKFDSLECMIVSDGVASSETLARNSELQSLKAQLWEKNDVVFNSSSYDEKKVYEVAILRVGFWCKCKWPSSTYSLNEFVRNPALIALEAFRG
ncbi:hypothetical protein V6N13_013145 [Hibiscus sabdariffa]